MMNNQFVKYSPEEIFEIFTEQHRLASPLNPMAVETFELKKDTLIADLQDVQNLLPWRQWTEWLNQCFNMEASRNEWRAVVKPVTKKTLWGVCLFISDKAEKEVVKPIRLLGRECLSAAVFLTLKKNLKRKGAATKDLKPSTNISEYLNNDDNFSPLLEEATLTGFRTFEELTERRMDNKRKVKYWIERILPITISDRTLFTGELVTFRDLVNKTIENQAKTGGKSVGET
jgi:hypothetical protein